MQAALMPKVVNLKGALTVERAGELRDDLAEGLEGAGGVMISLSLVDDIDLACLQVIYAAKKSAAAVGKEFHFLGTISPRLSKRLAACGLLRSPAARAEEFEAALVGF